MDLWPAIDIRDGRAVRLLRGDFDAETRYGDPVAVAESYVAAGARRLHLVDLDAARTGEPVNRSVIAALVSRVGAAVAVQVGGGVRSVAAAEALFGLGVERVVLGTVAVEQPGLLAFVAQRWPGRVVAGLDYRRLASGAKELALRGWSEGSGRLLADVVISLAETELDGVELAGVAVTDISRDGTGAGPDVATLLELLAISAVPVVASGGVASSSDLQDLAGVAAAGRTLDGVIVGKALLSGVMSMAEALAACAARP